MTSMNTEKHQISNLLNDVNLNALIEIAKTAGQAILEIYKKDFDVEYKADNSPLTEADKRSNEIIVAGLNKLCPDIPVLAEESKQIPYEKRKNWDLLWLVDPLDGTKEFIKRNGEFAVNIALIEKNKPVFGIIHSPVLNVTYYAIKNKGCYRINHDRTVDKLKASNLITKDKITIVGSRSHESKELREFVDKIRNEYDEVKFISAGSSLKMCRIAEGTADIYPRLGPTMEWDIASGHIIINESGKKVYQFDSESEITYNKPSLVNGNFICK